MRRVPIRRRRRYGKVRPHGVIKCRAHGRHQVGWCLRLCTPSKGIGDCGRIAPHALKGPIRVMVEYSEKERERKKSEEPLDTASDSV